MIRDFSPGTEGAGFGNGEWPDIQGHAAKHSEGFPGVVDGWTVRVQDGQARLSKVTPGGPGELIFEDADLQLFPPQVRTQLYTLILESVLLAGGNLDRAGLYPPIPELVALFRSHQSVQERAQSIQVTLYSDDFVALEHLQRALAITERSGVIRVALRLASRGLKQVAASRHAQ